MKYTIGLLAALVLLVAPASVFAQGATGSWQLTLQTPQGNNVVDLTLSQTGNAVSGGLNSPMGAVSVTGTVNGAALTLTAKIAAMNLELGVSGTVAGDTIQGTVKFGDVGEFPFTGKRASAANTAAAPGAVAVASGAADLNGKWDVKLIVPGAGEIPATAVLKQDGDKLSGTLNSIAGEATLNGSVAGASVKLNFEADTPQGKLPVSLTGDMGVGGITGKASIAGLGEADWTATRATVQ